MKNKGIEKLRKISGVAGLNQTRLAERIGITSSAISLYYSGKRGEKVDPIIAMKICKAFPAIKMEDFYEGYEG